MTRVWAAASFLVLLHGPDGQPIELNPRAIVTVRPPRANEHFGAGLKCLIHTTDGKFIAVRESCGDVNEKLAQ